MEQLVAILAPLISAYAGDFGWAVQVVAVIGSLRLFFKPIMSAIGQAVKDSESKKDDDVYNVVVENKFYKAFVFLLDLVGSIKVPKKK